MDLEYLKNIDYDMSIRLSDFNVRSADIDKIQKAWCEGRYVYMKVTGDTIDELSIRIFTGRYGEWNPEDVVEITKEWYLIYIFLKKEHLPAWMLEKALEKLENGGYKDDYCIK